MASSLGERSSLLRTAGLEMPSLPRDVVLEDPNTVLTMVDFQTLADGTQFPVSTHHPSVQRRGKSLVKSPEPCVSAKNVAAAFPLEFGIKCFILLIPWFLAFIGLQVFILPTVLCFFTSLWWVIIALAAIKAKHIQSCINKSTASRLREVIISLYLAHLMPYLEYGIQLWAPSARRMPTNGTESNGGLL